MAEDSFALDRSSVRSVDQDGHLHVSESPISKANICEYYGREIPGADELGLNPDRLYRLLRDPEELEKATKTFDGKPLLIVHRQQTAEDNDRSVTVGAVRNPRWEAPYLMAALDVWDGDAIKGINSGNRRELSSSYRYRADMTPGNYEGEPFDGVMRDIVGNHTALVPAGRAGNDVMVGDAAIGKGIIMATKATAMSRRAAVALGALTAHIQPRLAADAAVDLGPALAGVTAKNWKTSKSKIASAVQAACKGKLAADADVDDVIQLLDKLDSVGKDLPDNDEPAAKPVIDEDLPGESDPAKDPAEDDDLGEAICKILDGKVPPEDIAKIVAMVKPAGVDEAPAKPGVPDAAAPLPEKDKEVGVTKGAMDAAIKVAVDTAVGATIKRMNDIAEAKEAVRPVVGGLAVAMDSAAAVYKVALDHIQAQGHPVDLTGVPEATYGAVFRAIAPSVLAPRPRSSGSTMAADAAAAEGFDKRFPTAKRARVIG